MKLMINARAREAQRPKSNETLFPEGDEKKRGRLSFFFRGRRRETCVIEIGV
jgi:hypothetical protein